MWHKMAAIELNIFPMICRADVLITETTHKELNIFQTEYCEITHVHFDWPIIMFIQ
jgi:hypothetical protein